MRNSPDRPYQHIAIIHFGEKHVLLLAGVNLYQLTCFLFSNVLEETKRRWSNTNTGKNKVTSYSTVSKAAM